jgi:hypothetical protein
MTKSRIFFTILIGVLLKTTASFAFSLPQNCQYQITHRDNLQFSQRYQKDVSECWFSIHPMNGYQSMTYRSYLVTSSGMLFVFNSFGEGSSTKTTGAREFYFFPREVYTNGLAISQDKVSVRMNSKLTLEFESKNLYPLNTPNIVLKNLSAITPKNAGGVEVLRYNGVYLDTGFVMGQSPSAIKTNKSMFKNQFGQKCLVQNKQIFGYRNDDPILMHDILLHEIVAKQCPDFKWID